MQTQTLYDRWWERVHETRKGVEHLVRDFWSIYMDYNACVYMQSLPRRLVRQCIQIRQRIEALLRKAEELKKEVRRLIKEGKNLKERKENYDHLMMRLEQMQTDLNELIKKGKEDTKLW
jgi:predicted nuclease with TOPRIM domain